jgi:hypothetical protein
MSMFGKLIRFQSAHEAASVLLARHLAIHDVQADLHPPLSAVVTAVSLLAALLACRSRFGWGENLLDIPKHEDSSIIQRRVSLARLIPRSVDCDNMGYAEFSINAQWS